MTLLLAAALLVVQAEPPLELSPTPFAQQERPTLSVQLGPKGKSLITMTDDGVIRSFDLKKETFSWASEPRVKPEMDVAVIEPFCIMDVGDKIAASAYLFSATYTTVHLEDGTRSGGTGGTSAMQKTGAILVDPKDRWVWLGTERGTMTRLVVDSVSGWSNRAMKNGGVSAIDVDAKGNDLAVGGEDGTIRFVGNKSCNVDKKAIFEGRGQPITAVTWHPKGKDVASGDEGGQVLVRSRRSGKTRLTLDTGKSAVRCIAFHPKGDWLAVGNGEGRLTIWSSKSGEVIAEATLDGTPKGVRDIVVLDKGKRIVVAAGGKELVSFDMTGVGK